MNSLNDVAHGASPATCTRVWVIPSRTRARVPRNFHICLILRHQTGPRFDGSGQNMRHEDVIQSKNRPGLCPYATDQKTA